MLNSFLKNAINSDENVYPFGLLSLYPFKLEKKHQDTHTHILNFWYEGQSDICLRDTYPWFRVSLISAVHCNPPKPDTRRVLWSDPDTCLTCCTSRVPQHHFDVGGGDRLGTT